MNDNLFHSLQTNFLGNSSTWYKQTIIAFLILNPIVYFTVGHFAAGWLLIAEFIFTLAMALKCYPLQPGGLLAIEALIIGMTTPENVYHEIDANLEVILLLVFMVAGIHFMRDLLLFLFTKILLGVRSKMLLSFLFCISSAFLSAFLDALTVTAVLISVAVGFYTVYYNVAYGKAYHHSSHEIDACPEEYKEDMEKFRSFMRSLIMHGAVGTALGGVCTLVGEPQNLLIAEIAGWDFVNFFLRMAPVTMPTLVAGLATCLALEATGIFGYGEKLPPKVREVLAKFQETEDEQRTNSMKAKIVIQGVVAVGLIFSLALHIAPVGLIGLGIIVLLTAFNGVVEEHKIGHAFEEALPFTALLVVFFAIVAVIHDLHLFTPITDFVLAQPVDSQPIILFFANGVLSMISDNVFVATVYINEVYGAFTNGDITREHFDKLAIAINTGTNLPSVATPNGQAAFLFLLTSALAPLIRLSYMRMLIMALPYTIVLTIVGAAAIMVAL